MVPLALTGPDRKRSRASVRQSSIGRMRVRA